MASENDDEKSPAMFSKNIWRTSGIVAFVIIVLLMLKTLFSVLLLVFAGIILAVYFRAFGSLLQKYFKC